MNPNDFRQNRLEPLERPRYYDESSRPDRQARLRTRPYTWLEVFMEAATQPGEDTFDDLLGDPGARPGRAYLWLFWAVIVGSLIDLGGRAINGSETPWFLIPLLPVMGGVFVLLSIMAVSLVHAVATSLEGKGQYEEMIYVFSAAFVPLWIAGVILREIPILNCLGLPLLLYMFYAIVAGVKTVYRLDWFSATLAGLALPVTFFGLACILGFLAA